MPELSIHWVSSFAEKAKSETLAEANYKIALCFGNQGQDEEALKSLTTGGTFPTSFVLRQIKLCPLLQLFQNIPLSCILFHVFGWALIFSSSSFMCHMYCFP